MNNTYYKSTNGRSLGLLFIVILAVIMLFASISCTSSKTAFFEEDKLILTRRYVGTFEDYRIVEGYRFLEPSTYWIKTSLDSIYGKIHIFTRKDLELTIDDRLYIRRTHYEHPGINNTVYMLESSNGEIYYPLYSLNRSSQVRHLITALFDNYY